MNQAIASRRLPIGAEVLAGQVHFRVWAPRCRRVEVVLEGQNASRLPILEAESGGYFAGVVPTAKAGDLYRFRLDGGQAFPDPASRFQPRGPHGPSQIIDSGAFRWSDHDWPGAGAEGQVIYEIHIGTFTREGTWEAAGRELPELAYLGITVVEVMPVAEFPGRFGWGYDGVDLFAPTRLYGQPDDFRRFVDRAHAAGLGVILDVVYNHLGPDGNYLKQFSEAYFTDRHKNEWGEAISFDGQNSGPVREFFIANARYWIDEYHVDGLRLDATQQIFDGSDESILTAIGRSVRAAAGGRATLIVAENEAQEARLVRPAEQGGSGLDALWNDDFHHAARVALTGHDEAYYSDYQGTAQELLSAVKWGYLYQGQRYSWQKKRRGSPALDLKPANFINFIENHDQVANSARGQRLHLLSSFGQHKAMTALLLLTPGTPMLFQGQEFGSSKPFPYFADHKPDLARLVYEGRKRLLAQFPSVAMPQVLAAVPDPGDVETFERAKLDFTERKTHAAIYTLHRDLLKLRREDPVLNPLRQARFDGAVLAVRSLVLRFFGPDGEDRLLVVNLDQDLHLDSAPEPLLAPPEGSRWRTLWSSEDPRYDGNGTPELETEENWRIPSHATVVLAPVVVSRAREPRSS
jgi:maltooligosyltrehalose trehalohydrolase